MSKIREPAVAGMFYPANERELRNEISILLDVSENEKDFEKVYGLVCPHAGYVYSGKTAAHAYNIIKNKNYETVIIISPSHYEYFEGSSIYDGDEYKTPLGNIHVDKKLRDKIISGSGTIFAGENGHGKEHALEVQLPFLQTVLKNFQLVPIVIGDQHSKFTDELAERLADAVDDKTLVVASSDLSHFYSKQTAYKFDSLVEESILNFNYQKLQEDLMLNKCFACGGGGIAAMMKSAEIKGIRNSEILSRTDSGDVTGDNSSVVGYLSAVIF